MIGRLVGTSDDFEAVDVAEFLGFGRRRTGHAAELLVHAEIVLEGDRGQRLVFRLDRHLFLGFERLVLAFRITAARHHAAGEFVDDDDFVVADDVVLVLLEELVGLQRIVDVVDDRDVLDVVERLRPSTGSASRSRFSSFSVPSSEKLAERCFSSIS